MVQRDVLRRPRWQAELLRQKAALAIDIGFDRGRAGRESDPEILLFRSGHKVKQPHGPAFGCPTERRPSKVTVSPSALTPRRKAARASAALICAVMTSTPDCAVWNTKGRLDAVLRGLQVWRQRRVARRQAVFAQHKGPDGQTRLGRQADQLRRGSGGQIGDQQVLRPGRRGKDRLAHHLRPPAVTSRQR